VIAAAATAALLTPTEVHTWYDISKDIIIPLATPLIALFAISAAVWVTRAHIHPLREQLQLMRSGVQEDRQHREFSIAWAVALEALRIGETAKIKREFLGSAMPKDRLLISISSLARGERSDIVYLNLDSQSLLARLVSYIDLYNATVDSIHTVGPEQNVLIKQGSDAAGLLEAIEKSSRGLAEKITRDYPATKF
jgi:hypothetical protein